MQWLLLLLSPGKFPVTRRYFMTNVLLFDINIVIYILRFLILLIDRQWRGNRVDFEQESNAACQRNVPVE